MVPLADLDKEGARIVDSVLANGPQAIAETKEWILRSAQADLDEAGFAALVESHASKRQSAEAAEGLASFSEKRAAKWSWAKYAPPFTWMRLPGDVARAGPHRKRTIAATSSGRAAPAEQRAA